MQTLLHTLIGLVLFMVVVGVIWRLVSKRQSLPCPVWLSWLVELDNPFTRTNRAAVILRHLNIQPGMSVLDAGCGPGRLSIPAAQLVGPDGRIVALDMQTGMLKRARDKAQHAGVKNIEFVEAGLGEGRLETNTFDCALLVTVLGEIPDKSAALKEIHAALKPGGVLSITEIIFDPHFQRRSTVTQLATGTGFREAGFFGNRIAYTMHLKKPD